MTHVLMRCRNRLSYFQNADTLKVMLILYKDNPDVPFRILLDESGIEHEKLSSIINELMGADLIKIKASIEKKEDLLSLREEARMALNRLNANELLAKV